MMPNRPPPLGTSRRELEYDLHALHELAPALKADTPARDWPRAYAAAAGLLWAQACETDKAYVLKRLQDIYRDAHGVSRPYPARAGGSCD